MGSNITPEQRKQFEEHMKKYPPYKSTDPEVNEYDGDYDTNRLLSYEMQRALNAAK